MAAPAVQLRAPAARRLCQAVHRRVHLLPAAMRLPAAPRLIHLPPAKRLPRLKRPPLLCPATRRLMRLSNRAARATAPASRKVANQAVANQAVANSAAANLAATIQTPIPTARRVVPRRRARFAIKLMPRLKMATT